MRPLAGLEAPVAQVGHGVRMGARSRIVAREVAIGDEVVVGDDVQIACDRLAVGPGSRISTGSRLLAPEIRIGEATVIGEGFGAELNERFLVGRQGDLGRGVRIVAHGFAAGDHLWLTDAVVVGGGGARGPRSTLTIGDRSAIMDRCFINVSESVSIGSDTALSNGVTVLTHSLWYPVLLGGTTVFAPTRIGDRNILYVNAVIAPGVTMGDDVTIAAGAVVLQDVPDGSTAVGNPARVFKSTPPVPRSLEPARRDAIVREALRSYAETLPTKGVEVESSGDPDVLIVTHAGTRHVIRYLPAGASNAAGVDITLAFGASAAGGRCHFDLEAATMTGAGSAVAEDLRDHLRRRTIRIFTNRPFQALPPATIARLRRALEHP